MLVEEGFEVVSIDASDKMLKYALKERWDRRNEKNFDNWSKFHITIIIRKLDTMLHSTKYVNNYS